TALVIIFRMGRPHLVTKLRAIIKRGIQQKHRDYTENKSLFTKVIVRQLRNPVTVIPTSSESQHAPLDGCQN
ncbi:MAG: hypothetical protein K2Q97_15950, partial [Burkholderiaceae bacterium]|nr:hypothetical protein [Burkholderiaceae bacterium]